MCHFLCGIQVPMPSCHPSRALEADAGGTVKHRVVNKNLGIQMLAYSKGLRSKGFLATTRI